MPSEDIKDSTAQGQLRRTTAHPKAFVVTGNWSAPEDVSYNSPVCLRVSAARPQEGRPEISYEEISLAIVSRKELANIR